MPNTRRRLGSARATRLSLGAALPLAAFGLTATMIGCGDGANELPEPPKMIKAAHPVPAIIGGTLLVSRDGSTAIASDPDRDRVSLVDVANASLKATIQLERAAEPGRLAEDGAGRVHVALRRTGEIATIDIATGELLQRASVCTSPRGLAYDATADALVVACASGELAVVDPASLEVVRADRLERDLRDVVVLPAPPAESGSPETGAPEYFLSLFREAKLLRVTDPLAGSTEVVQRMSLPSTEAFDEFTPQAEPRVAWRAAAIGDDAIVIAHQQHLRTAIDIAPQSSYGSAGPCGNGIVQSSLTILPRDSAASPEVAPLNLAVLPVDVAAREDGQQVAVAAAASNQVFVVERYNFSASATLAPCGDTSSLGVPRDIPETPVAVAYAKSGEVLVQTREPATLVFSSGLRVDLEGESVFDSGHEIFHRPPGLVSLSCASCHPEGGDDAHTWNFQPMGVRRTQTLRGGIMQTLPLHWDGTLEDMGALVDEVMVTRMGGGGPGPRGEEALAGYIDELPALTPAPRADAAAIARGAALFNDAVVGCNNCHSGPMFTNNKTEDVGTGQALQVPTLVNIADRAPYMHDGCATTLLDRFGECGGGDLHGKTSHLSEAQLMDLVAYLESI